jgi:hypothetical protein
MALRAGNSNELPDQIMAANGLANSLDAFGKGSDTAAFALFVRAGGRQPSWAAVVYFVWLVGQTNGSQGDNSACSLCDWTSVGR